LQIQEKLRQGIRRLDPGLEGTLPFLGMLFALPNADHALAHLSPKDKRQQLFEAMRALTVAACQRRPQVVIVENLHWTDQSSEDYWYFLIESLAGLPLLLLTTQRTGYTVRWADKTYYTQIALDVLSEPDTAAMIAALVGSHDMPAYLLQLIQEKAGGNPLFIEEVTHSLLERGLLVWHHGGLCWTGDAVVEFPTTIQDIIRARLDRLEEPVKRTVQTAAVIGREFGQRLLTRLSDMAAQVQLYLETLKHLELIHEKRFFPELEYIFKHAVIQDVAYQSLLVRRRQELHGAIGRAIEELYAERLEEQAAILAYHYTRSEQQEKAMTYALLAGDWAARLYAHAEATTYYAQALTIARALPASPEAQRAQVDAILKLATVGMSQQDSERDQQQLEQARALAEALHDDLRLAQVLYWLGRIHYVLGDFQAAIVYARQSLALADRLGDDTLAAPPVHLMGRIYWQQSDYAPASHMLERGVELARRLGDKSEEATAAGFAGVVCGFMGEFERAFPYLDHGLHLAQELHNPFAEAAAYYYRGVIRGYRGLWTQALTDYQEARRVAEGARDLVRVYLVQFYEGWAHTMAGDPSRGRVLLEESLALAAQIGIKFLLAWPKTFLATCLLALGELEAVLPLCHEAMRLARETHDTYVHALAYRTLAQALSCLVPVDSAQVEHAFAEAMRLQQEIGAKPELARTYVSYALLLRGQGEKDKARAYLTQAYSMFQQMGMAWDLAQAEQVLRTLS
jgi:predicted ATPase